MVPDGVLLLLIERTATFLDDDGDDGGDCGDGDDYGDDCVVVVVMAHRW